MQSFFKSRKCLAQKVCSKSHFYTASKAKQDNLAGQICRQANLAASQFGGKIN